MTPGEAFPGAKQAMVDWLRRLRDAPARKRFARQRADIRRVPGCVVNFGGILRAGVSPHGGAVKLLSLEKAFPSAETEFSLLYLVSSSLPPFAEDLAKLCARRRIAVVWNQNGVGYPAWAGREAEGFNKPMRAIRAMADHVIYQSDFCRRSAEKFLGPCAAPSITLLNPVDLARFTPPDEPVPERAVRLLAMGTQNYRERALCVIAAAGRLRAAGVECTLTLAGRLLWRDGERDVANCAAESGLREAFRRVGEFSRDEAVELCRSHHVLLHPKHQDPCPTVVAEALACGLPVVASDSGGLPEMVPPDAGRLIPVPEDWDQAHTPSPEALATATREILARLPQFSSGARRAARERFDETRWVEAHREIFSRAIAER